MTELRVVSADSHVSEPIDLWRERLDRRYRDRAPHAIPNPNGMNSGRLHQGAVKGPGAVDFIVPRLERLLALP